MDVSPLPKPIDFESFIMALTTKHSLNSLQTRLLPVLASGFLYQCGHLDGFEHYIAASWRRRSGQ